MSCVYRSDVVLYWFDATEHKKYKINVHSDVWETKMRKGQTLIIHCLIISILFYTS